MIVPNKTIFSNNPWGEGNLTYGDVRNIKNNKEKIEVIKARLDALLINQIKPLAQYKDNYDPIIWAPFPLTTLTFLGIETIGRIIGNKEKIEKDNFEASKKYSRPIYKLIDLKLINKPTKNFYLNLEERLGKSIKTKIVTYSDVIHKYMRNTYTHGFQGLLGYLNHKLIDGWIIDNGYIVINPYWFWDKFYNVYKKIFDQLINKPDDRQLYNTILYFEDLIR